MNTTDRRLAIAGAHKTMHRSTLIYLIAALLLAGSISCGGSSGTAPLPRSEYDGICSAASQSNYVLPYPVGSAYVVYQGYPPFNHPPSFKFAVDFSMPSRSSITAARPGIVEFVEESYEDNDYDLGHENVVIIDHGDGTFARYVHLVKDGALVERGESVTRGQPVGLSGATGSGVQHLHFDVTTGCSQRTCQTIPVCFSNARAHPNGLVRGESYRAEPY